MLSPITANKTALTSSSIAEQTEAITEGDRFEPNSDRLSTITPSSSPVDDVQLGYFRNSHAPSADEAEAMALYNAERARLSVTQTRHTQGPEVVRAFAEFEEVGYLIFNEDTLMFSQRAKEIMVENLPQDVDLVVLISEDRYQWPDRVRRQYAQFIDPSRIHLVYTGVGDSEDFWARDAVPFPVWVKGEDSLELGVVDAKYYKNAEGDYRISKYFDAQLVEHDYYFEGGNLLVDTRGNGFVVNNSRVENIPDEIFANHYGINNLIRLPRKGGIGHVDERLKLLSDTEALTDTPEYVDVLEAHGYNVTLVPQPVGGNWENYLNAVLINGTAFVPTYGRDTDEEALKAYADKGFKVIPVPARGLTNQGAGSIHCITMTYPKGELPLTT